MGGRVAHWDRPIGFKSDYVAFLDLPGEDRGLSGVACAIPGWRHRDATHMDAFELEINLTHNVAVIRFRDVVSPSAMAPKIAAAEAEISKLQRGFTVAADLTGLEHMEIDCVPYVTRMMDLFLGAGVGLVVRVIPDPDKDIGLTLLSHTHYRGRVPIRTCASTAELTPEIRSAFEH